MKIGIIGTGKISSAVVESICTSEMTDYEIYLSPRNQERSIELANKFTKVYRMDSNQGVLEQSEIILIALRPGVYKLALSELQFTSKHIIVSLIPFLGLGELKELVAPAKQLSRAIPLPTIVNHVCPVPIFNPNKHAYELFSKISQPLIIDSEKELHTIWTLTCLISPYYDLMGALSSWSKDNGITKSQADKYIANMFNSLSHAAAVSDNPDFENLSNHAATPGGLNEKTAIEVENKGAHKAYTDAADGILQMFDKVKSKTRLGPSSIEIPPIIFGTSCLGNLYESIDDSVKLSIIQEWFNWVESPVLIDTAGKYGAGLALEVIGKGLSDLKIDEKDIIISNKLGWIRTPLKGHEPTFEPGVWADLEHDAVQKISYDGILECYEQGLDLLGGKYKTDIVSVHDPDEYLTAATSAEDRKKRLNDIVEAYRALNELRDQGKVKAVGVGAKDWKVIKELTQIIKMDWVMISVSFTIMNHPSELTDFISQLTNQGIGVINSAVFHSGFLTGGSFYDYRKVDPSDEVDKHLYAWRESFYQTCEDFQVNPFEACVAFGISPPGVVSIAMNTSKPSRIKDNALSVIADIPDDFWKAMKSKGLIKKEYLFVANKS